MSLSSEEEERLVSLLDELEANRAHLNPWERDFLGDQQKRYKDYGPKMSLSPKQWGVLDKMHAKVASV